MSPLAKWHRSEPGITERFELFVMKKEVGDIKICTVTFSEKSPSCRMDIFRYAMPTQS